MSTAVVTVEPPLVLATEKKLSDRFGLIVSSNNPFRPPPNDGLKLKQPRLALPTTTPKVAFNGFGDFTRSVIDSEEAKILRDPGVELEAALVFPKPSIGPNPVTVMRAQKDAEILRLRSELREARIQLNSTKNFKVGNVLRTIQKGPMKRGGPSAISVAKRGGGGVVARSAGGHLNLRNAKVLHLFGGNGGGRNFWGGRQNGQGNQGRKAGGGSRRFTLNKGRLDKDLDAYMAKSKTKQKSDLDKELDEYMAQTKTRGIVANRLAQPENPNNDPVATISKGPVKVEIAQADVVIPVKAVVAEIQVDPEDAEMLDVEGQ